MRPNERLTVPATVLSFVGGAPSATERTLPTEVAVELRVASLPFAVMMLTPADLEDFATGFCVTEGLAAPGEVRGAVAEEDALGLRLAIDLAPAALHRALARRRAMTGRTSCGVCGVGDLAALSRPVRQPVAAPPIETDAIARALEALAGATPLSRETRATHAAAYAGRDGALVATREDVGRHNALDKLIGALIRRGVAPEDGFVLVTSRASFEMVEKVAVWGGSVLVAISAPTSLALDRARIHRMTLVGIAREDTMTVFCGAERLVERMPA